MKRRDFLRSSSIAASTPLFLDGVELPDIDFGELTGGLFGNSNPDKDVPIKERIGHPPPSVSVRASDAEGGYTADVTVDEFHGWETVNVFPMFESAADQGGAQVTIEPGNGTVTVPAGREGAPETVPDDIDVAFEARYKYGGIYFGVGKYRDGRLEFVPAHEVPDYCWWRGWFGCRVDDPVANEQMTTPG